MGVSHLWQSFNKAQAVDHSTLPHLAEKYFHQNDSHGFRLGIDATQWHFHVRDAPAEHGHNAALKTLFFRILNLLRHGVLPVLVFDGTHQPFWKRRDQAPTEAEAARHSLPGSSPERSTRNSTVTHMLDLLGVPWFTAKGDGEAELAYLNQQEEIDGILSDDVDTLLFGGKTVLRHKSLGLSGNKDIGPLAPHICEDAPDGIEYDKENSYRIYTSAELEEVTSLDRDSFILIALLMGADYSGKGVQGIGPETAWAIANCDFRGDAPRLGTELVASVQELRDRPEALRAFLADWKERTAAELETNAHGFLQKRCMAGAARLRADPTWPSLPAINAYLNPPIHGKNRRYVIEYDKEVQIAELVQWAIPTFKWSLKEVEMCFRNNLYAYFVHREIRQAAIARDNNVPRSLTQYKLSVPRVVETGSVVSDIVGRATNGASEFVDSYSVELDQEVVTETTLLALPDFDEFPNVPENAGTGRRCEPPADPKIGDWRHYVPVALIKHHPVLRDMAQTWEFQQREKQRRKEEAATALEARRAEREERKRLGLTASPQKRKTPSSASLTPRTSRKMAAPPSMSESPQKDQSISQFFSPSKSTQTRSSVTPRQVSKTSEAGETSAAARQHFLRLVTRPISPEPGDDSEFSDPDLQALFSKTPEAPSSPSKPSRAPTSESSTLSRSTIVTKSALTKGRTRAKHKSTPTPTSEKRSYIETSSSSLVLLSSDDESPAKPAATDRGKHRAAVKRSQPEYIVIDD
ncbi:hypothetical protein ACM66B_002674 [Microbotryomycetes sp. NB124-2]